MKPRATARAPWPSTRSASRDTVPGEPLMTARAHQLRLLERRTLHGAPAPPIGLRLLVRPQSSVLQQRLYARIGASEGTIHRGQVLGLSARQNHVAEPLPIRAGHPAVLHEPLIRVVREHLAPQIRVVPRRVGVPPDVREIARPVPWRDER